MSNKTILDPACGGKAFYFTKDHPNVVYCDKRVLSMTVGAGRNARTLNINPDVVCDFTNLPFDDKSYYLVIWDPPHLIRGGDKSWMVQKYGKLAKNWQVELEKGFEECWRVLKPNGTLVFKWNETQVALREILNIFPVTPLCGNQRTNKGRTHLLVFFKEAEDE